MCLAVIPLGPNNYTTTEPASVRVSDEMDTLVAARDFPAYVDGICDSGGVASSTFTSPCDELMDAVLKINLSEPKHMMHLNVVLNSDESLYVKHIIVY